MLARDPVCKACALALSSQVDHVVAGDDHSMANLQGLCETCHQTKTVAEAAAARSRTA